MRARGVDEMRTHAAHGLRAGARLIGSSGRRWLALSAAAGLGVAAADAGLTLVLAALFRALAAVSPAATLSHDGARAPDHWLALLVGVAVARAGAVAAAQVAAQRVYITVSTRLRLDAVELLLRGPLGDHGAETQVRFSERAPKVAQLCQLTASLLGAAVQISVLFAFALWLAPRPALVAALAVVLLAALVGTANRRLRRIAAQIGPEQKAVAVWTERLTRALMLVRVLRTTEEERTRVAARLEALAVLTRRAALRIALAGAFPGAIGGALLVAAVVHYNSGVLAPPALVGLAYVLWRSTSVLGGASQAFTTLTTGVPALNAALTDRAALLSLPPAETPLVTSSSAARPVSVALDHVTFRYPDGALDVLAELCASVEPGTLFVVRGPSGSGKTTLLALLLGLERPLAGSVLIDGKTPREFIGAGGRVAYAGPDPFVSAGSVRQSLTYGLRCAVDDAELEAVLDELGLAPVVSRLEGRLEATLGEGGQGLSAGELARISLARALLQRPQLLVLDEATAHLDEASEAIVVAALKRARRTTTTVAVSHRLALSQAADRSLELAPRAARLAEGAL